MKRSFLVIAVAVVASVAAYCIYFQSATRSAHAMLAQPEGQLEWLRREFNLDDEQFAKAKQLHETYRPLCDQMCVRIAAANSEADALIAKSKTVTPEIEAALRKCAAST